MQQKLEHRDGCYVFGCKNKIKFKNGSGNVLSEKWTFCQTKRSSNVCSILFDLETLNFTTQMSFTALRINWYCYVKSSCICAWIFREISVFIGDWLKKENISTVTHNTKHCLPLAGNWGIRWRRGNAVVAAHAIGDRYFASTEYARNRLKGFRSEEQGNMSVLVHFICSVALPLKQYIF